MRISVAPLLMLLIAPGLVSGSLPRSVADDGLAIEVAATAPAPADTAPAPAERFLYMATWNGLPVADAELTIEPLGPGGPHPRAATLQGRAATNQALDLLWRMRDSFEATVATDPPAPRRFVLRQHENDRRRQTTIVRHPRGTHLHGENHRRGKKPRIAEVALHRRLHDPASLAYLIRTLPPELERPQTYEVFTGTKTYSITVTPRGEGTLDAAGRTWPARKLHLALRLVPSGTGSETPKRGAAPKVQEADLWISSDRERLPLRLQGRTFWGWVVVQLSGRAPLAPARART